MDAVENVVDLIIAILKNADTYKSFKKWFADFSSTTQKYQRLKEYGNITHADFAQVFLQATHVIVSFSQSKLAADKDATIRPCRRITPNKGRKDSSFHKVNSFQSSKDCSLFDEYDSNFPTLVNGTSKKLAQQINSEPLPSFVHECKTEMGKSHSEEKVKPVSCLSKKTEELKIDSNTPSASKPFSTTSHHNRTSKNRSSKGIESCHVENTSIQNHVLYRLAEIYCNVLHSELISNLQSEILFILHILIRNDKSVERKPKTKFDKEIYQKMSSLSLFKSHQEIKDFACNVLSSQPAWFEWLDIYTLQALSIAEPKAFLEISRQIIESKDGRSDYSLDETKYLEQYANIIKHIPLFCSYYDNRYHVLRLQFESILMQWKNKINFERDIFKTQVMSLIQTAHELRGESQLAELFVEELIDVNNLKDSAHDERIKYFVKAENEKFLQLSKRLTEPSPSILEQPELFTESEMPLREFFGVILMNSYLLGFAITQHILRFHVGLEQEINNISLQNTNDTIDKTRLSIYFLKTQLKLARFLGLSHIIDYSLFQNSNENTRKQGINLRSRIMPPLNVIASIRFACETGTLVFAIPWIVEYLLMSGQIGSELPFMEILLLPLLSLKMNCRFVQSWAPSPYNQTTQSATNLLKRFVIIPKEYCHLKNEDESDAEIYLVNISSSTNMVINCVIGRIFDSPNISEEYFNQLIAKMKSVKWTNVIDCVNEKATTLDCTNSVVGDLLIQECCPKLRYLKYISLSCINKGVSSARLAATKNMPLCEDKNVEPTDEEVKRDLEACFFNAYKGLCSLVDTLAIRVSQICISSIGEILIEEKYKQALIVRQYVQFDITDLHVPKAKKALETNIENMFMLINQQIDEKKESRLIPALKLLHDADLPDSVVNTAEKIMCRKFHLLIQEWMKNHISPTEKIIDETIKDCIALKKFKIRETKDEEAEDNVVLSPTMRDFQEMINKIYFGKCTDITGSKIMQLLHLLDSEIKECTERNKLWNELYLISWDLVWCLVTCLPSVLDSDFVSNIIQFWCTMKASVSLECETRLLCPRNLSMAFLSPFKESIPAVVSLLVKSLIREGLLTVRILEDQSITLFQRSWKKDELAFISSLLKTIKCELGDSTAIDGLLLEWAYEMSQDIEKDLSIID